MGQALGQDVPEKAAEILSFWFGPEWRQMPLQADPSRNALWWQADPATDKYIRERFGRLTDQALEGGLEPWAHTPLGRLALILLLDQFTRHLYRDQAKAFAGDQRAQLLCLNGLDRGSDQALAPLQRVFFYLPLEHAEDAGLQRRCVQLFQSLLESVPEPDRESYRYYLEFARKHQEVIDRFGRFPHRNKALGRDSSFDEERFMRVEGRGF
ncbi:DUF924 family protein [Gammaproteobacteria bacterium AB-CW1]|uniref:DUF924 family protein n=1 Tax=Natronospira elongata TaxID=3110268 RepID=A0AAP6MLW0_9GAMM|nr:DUF924 family protein [Gammaproteobacteria bacterium AB-CW1]